MKQTTIHGQSYEFYSWQSLGEDVLKLAAEIIKTGQEFDRLVALAKGGLTFSRSMVDYLDIPDVSAVQIEFYSGIGTTNEMPVITQSMPVSVRNERILIFDDIADSGETLRVATEYLKYHGVKSMTTAVLVTKPWSTFKPDFSAKTSEAWVIFPNEARETIQELTKGWLAKGDSPDLVREQLLQIGFSEAEVAMFATLE